MIIINVSFLKYGNDSLDEGIFKIPLTITKSNARYHPIFHHPFITSYVYAYMSKIIGEKNNHLGGRNEMIGPCKLTHRR